MSSINICHLIFSKANLVHFLVSQCTSNCESYVDRALCWHFLLWTMAEVYNFVEFDKTLFNLYVKNCFTATLRQKS